MDMKKSKTTGFQNNFQAEKSEASIDKYLEIKKS